MTDIQQAREWASTLAGSVLTPSEQQSAAMQVIQSLPDRWVDAKKVRGLITRYIGNASAGPALRHLVKDLEALLPPSLPTLAELIEQGNDPGQYYWMQAEVFHTGELGCVMSADLYDESSKILFPNAVVKAVPWEDITPLPGEPKLEWPAQEPQPVVKTLHTVEDYETAAIGTVVRRQEIPWLAATFHKCVDGIWNSTENHEHPSSEMAGTARTVLWGPKP